MSGKSALLLGATGQVGQHILKELLLSPHFTKVGEYGRRLTSLDSVPVSGKDKIEQKQIDFDKLEEVNFNEEKWDVVFIALGTTRNLAGSDEAFEKIDRKYVINAARAAKGDDNHSQRLVYVSSTGADPSSRFLYTRSKGLTELGLANLGYGDTIVFRPAFLKGTARPDARIAENFLGVVTGMLSCISSNAEIHISTLAKSVVLAGRLGSSMLPSTAEAEKAGSGSAPFTLIANAGALGMAKEA